MKWNEVYSIIAKDQTLGYAIYPNIGYYCFKNGELRYYRKKTKGYESPYCSNSGSDLYQITEREDLVMKFEEALAIIRADKTKGMREVNKDGIVRDWYYCFKDGELRTHDNLIPCLRLSYVVRQDWIIIEIVSPEKQKIIDRIESLKEEIKKLEKEVEGIWNL